MKISVGDVFNSKKHKKGKCYKIDLEDKKFQYFFKFIDGTLMWMSKQDCKKDLTVPEKNVVDL